MSEYYFDGKGKAFRPIIVVLMARACNIHHNNSRWVIYSHSPEAALRSQGYHLVFSLMSSMYLRIHFMLSRVWLWVSKVTLVSGLGTFLFLLFHGHGRTTPAANKHFRKKSKNHIEFSHSEVKTTRGCAKCSHYPHGPARPKVDGYEVERLCRGCGHCTPFSALIPVTFRTMPKGKFLLQGRHFACESSTFEFWIYVQF